MHKAKKDSTMNNLSWLHISDLHFNTNDDYNQSVVAQELLVDIKRMMVERTIPFNFIFITGDLTLSGKIEEFNLVDKFINELISITNVEQENIVIVPGNHDVSWENIPFSIKSSVSNIKEKDDISYIIGNPYEKEAYLVGLNNYYAFIKSKFEWAKNKSLSYTNNYSVNGINISVLALNSAWLTNDKTSAKGEVIIGERQVREAFEKTINPNIVISLIHHSPDWIKWFDNLDVKNMLERRSDFILTGHEHLSDFFHKEIHTSDVFYISGGSLYESRYYSNSYNIVDIDLKSRSNKIVFRQFVDKDGGYWATVNRFNNEEKISFALPDRITLPFNIIQGKDELVEDVFENLNLKEEDIELPEIPKDLIKRIAKKECILFAGAGLSLDAGLPTWHNLLLDMIDRANDMGQFNAKENDELKELLNNAEYLAIAEVCRLKLGKREFANFIMEELTYKRGSKNHKILSEISFNSALTTNFDSFIEDYRQKVRVILPDELNRIQEESLNSISQNSFTIIKLHGTLDNADTIILTHQDYRELIFNQNKSNYRSNLNRLVSNKSILFIGFSFRDPNIDFALQEVITSFNGNTAPHYAIMPDVGSIKSDYFWNNYNIKIISIPVKKHGWQVLSLFLDKIKREVEKSSMHNMAYK